MRPSDDELAARFGTPLFVYDADVVHARFRSLREALPARCAVHFAVKANPSLGVLALLRSLGAGAEVASRGELLAALAAGFDPSLVLWAGPAKTDAELEAAARAGIAAIHAESEEEIVRLDALGRARGTAVPAGVRVQVAWSAGESNRIIGGGAPTKFGIDEESALGMAPSWARLRGVRLASVHVFSASNVRDAGALAEAWTRTLDLALRLRRLGLPIELVDLGGGLGVPHADGEEPLDLRALGGALSRELERLRSREDFAPRVAVEPGRFLVSEAGRYLVRVIARKESRGVTWLACDGGIHHLLRPALIGQPHRVRASGEPRSAGPLSRQRVVGPLCTSLDDFGEHELPDLRAGDLLCVQNAGAYGFTESMPLFLSHPVPAEILLLDGVPHLLRPRRDPDAWIHEQRIPPLLERRRDPC